jgi:hypothetical protein
MPSRDPGGKSTQSPTGFQHARDSGNIRARARQAEPMAIEKETPPHPEVLAVMIDSLADLLDKRGIRFSAAAYRAIIRESSVSSR